MQSDMRIEFFDIEICAIKELFIIIIIIISRGRCNKRDTAWQLAPVPDSSIVPAQLAPSYKPSRII